MSCLFKTIIICMAIVWIVLIDPGPGWCGGRLLVFAGNSMRAPLIEIGKSLQDKYGFRVHYVFGGSVALAQRIMLSDQIPDVFIPGTEYWARELKGIRAVKDYSLIANHIPVIIAPIDNHKVNQFHDFLRLDVRITLADTLNTSIGRVTRLMFEKAEFDLELLERTAKAKTVNQVVRWVEMGNADAGIVWEADVAGSERVRRVTIPAEYNQPDVIPICLMDKAPNPNMAEKYVDFVLTEGRAIFIDYGYFSTQQTVAAEETKTRRSGGTANRRKSSRRPSSRSIPGTLRMNR